MVPSDHSVGWCTNRPGQAGQDKQARTNRPGQTGQDKQARTNRPGQTGQDKQARKNRPGKTGQDKQARTNRPGQTGQDQQARANRPGQTGQDKREPCITHLLSHITYHTAKDKVKLFREYSPCAPCLATCLARGFCSQ